MKKRILKITAIIMLAMVQLVSWAQVEGGLHLGNLEFVRFSQMEMDKRTLFECLKPSSEIENDFINKVGGVAFVQTAVPEMQVQSIELGCDKEKNTTYVKINGVTYPIPLPVWQLQPIVEYANDEEYNAAVSIYGSNLGKCPIVYHPAFLDNLLGLRLLQSDMLLFQIDAVLELPADQTGYVMASTEMLKFSDFKENSQKRFNIWLRLKEHYADDYRTYILTDNNQTISFGITDGELSLRGYPYYCLFDTSKNDGKKYILSSYATDYLRNHWDDVYALNPVVMDAALNTCQWVAFFRYVKKMNNKNWIVYLENVRKLRYDAPAVYTPVSYYEKNDFSLSELKTIDNEWKNSLDYYDDQINVLSAMYTECREKADELLARKVKQRERILMAVEIETLEKKFSEIDERCRQYRDELSILLGRCKKIIDGKERIENQRKQRVSEKEGAEAAIFYNHYIRMPRDKREFIEIELKYIVIKYRLEKNLNNLNRITLSIENKLVEEETLDTSKLELKDMILDFYRKYQDSTDQKVIKVYQDNVDYYDKVSSEIGEFSCRYRVMGNLYNHFGELSYKCEEGARICKGNLKIYRKKDKGKR